MVPASNAVPVSNTSATAQENSETSNLLPSSRARGTGTASRYRNEPELASLATVSPQNSATTTISRNDDETSNVNSAKFSPPAVAMSARAANRLRRLPLPLSSPYAE